MELTDFNRGADFTPSLLEAFGSSGNPLIDRLWQKPAETRKQREAIATELFEVLLTGSSQSMRARVNRAIRSLPLTWESYWFLYQHRTLRGESVAWADAIILLILRLPLAKTLYQSERYGRALLVICECLDQLLFSSHVEGLNYEPHLKPKMLEILDVARWYADRHPQAKREVGLVVSPVVDFLYGCNETGELAGDLREKVLGLYTFLDKSLEVCEELTYGWSSVHKYCLHALGKNETESRIFKMAADIPVLVAHFRKKLSDKIGTDLAELLLSDDGKQLADFIKFLTRGERGDVLLRLLKAREVWTGTVGLDRGSTKGVLHLELNKFGSWRSLNDTICCIAEQEIDASDGQMAELVETLANTGNIIAEVTVSRALNYCKTRDYPKTLGALENLAITGALTTVPYFDETLTMVNEGLLSLRA